MMVEKKEKIEDLESLVRCIKRKAEGKECFFRGENECFSGDIPSALYRELSEVEEMNTIGEINKTQELMLKRIRERALFELPKEDDALIAELRHFKHLTNIIDFTYDCLIAVFFACEGASEKQCRVIIVDEEKIRTNDIYKVIRPKTDQLRYATNRILAQKSVFLSSDTGKLDLNDSSVEVIEIPGSQKLKLKILKELKSMHGIERTTLFNDLFGIVQQEEMHLGASVCIYRGMVRNVNEEHHAAIEEFNNAIEQQPDSAEAYFNRALAQISLGKNIEAIEDFDMAASLDDASAATYNNRGLAKQALGKMEEAIEDYDNAISRNPGLPEAYNNRGLAKQALGKMEEAVEAYDNAISRNPEFAEAYNNRGIAKQALDKMEEAIEAYDNAISRNPEFAEAYNNRGYAKHVVGKREEAIKDFDAAIRLNPEFVGAYNNRGIVNLTLGNEAEAIKDYDTAISLDPNKADTYYNRGLANKALGNEVEAIEDFNKAIKEFSKMISKDSNLAVAHYYRGMAYRALGNEEEANKDYAKASEIDPRYMQK